MESRNIFCMDCHKLLAKSLNPSPSTTSESTILCYSCATGRYECINHENKEFQREQ